MSKVVDEHRRKAASKVSFYIIVTSDTLYDLFRRGEKVDDENGVLISKILEAEGQIVKGRSIVPNDPSTIKREIDTVIDALKPDVIITTGGTGLGNKDVTIEVVEGLFEKKIPGFGELLRFLSFNEIGSAAMLTRATAGVYKKTVIFSIPGSPHAVELALKRLIIPEAGHIVTHVRG
ncbi:MAG: molybdenum cofactor biosynthesis protein MoaB [Candidatus Nezhaarchaeota archaeon]|nr:molybdenum cofactor biosynthesis protein MoaB [Candidatus Nezhaarchaeota archaeon]